MSTDNGYKDGHQNGKANGYKNGSQVKELVGEVESNR
jgi:hypothetical protein